jgi:hypothetical protein
MEGFNPSIKGLTGSIIVNMIIKEQGFVPFLFFYIIYKGKDHPIT